MEEGDRNFSQLADELDGLIANYAAIASKKEIQEEMAKSFHKQFVKIVQADYRRT
jgi:hypothetical protein